MSLSSLGFSVAAISGFLLLYCFLKPKHAVPLPPGPPGLPFIGNVADMPTSMEWVTFAEWGKKWGGIISVKLFGRSMIIVNSAQVMAEFEKKGSIYSDRPRLEMGGELVGYKDTLVLAPYGPRFRTFRKLFAQYLGTPTIVEQHNSIVEYETRRFLKRTLSNEANLNGNLRKLAGGIIMQLTYGYEVKEGEDPFVTLIESANTNFSAVTSPGAFLVDFFPILKRFPEWLPGMGFLALAREWAKETRNMIEVPYNFTKQQMAVGTARPSFVSKNLENNASMSQDDVFEVKLAASSMYGGGAETTVSAEYAFFLAMVLFPGVQRKAQAEIDAVVGGERLPTLADRPHLPYVNALVTELLRWNSVAPSGGPHAALEDGIIDGYLIPKGSIIIANLWNMLHDPEVYPEPFEFRPERHIATPGKPAQKNPRTICFGFGRRVCPGMYLADTSIFSLVVCSLAVFNIEKAVENGVEITPIHENTSGTISFPKPFKCLVRPRSQKAVSLVYDELSVSQ